MCATRNFGTRMHQAGQCRGVRAVQERGGVYAVAGGRTAESQMMGDLVWW